MDMTLYAHRPAPGTCGCPTLTLTDEEPAVLFTLLLVKGVLEPKVFVPWPAHPGSAHVGDQEVALTPEGRVYLDLLDMARSVEAPGDRIPDHKFMTRLGWHVTVRECRTLVRVLEVITLQQRAQVLLSLQDRARVIGTMTTAMGTCEAAAPEAIWHLLAMQQYVVHVAMRARRFAALCLNHDGFDVW